MSPHVDRNPLIALAIINVAQDPDMTEDWPLEVIDREGKAVNVSMVPGDMVLYESGTLIHGVARDWNNAMCAGKNRQIHLISNF